MDVKDVRPQSPDELGQPPRGGHIPFPSCPQCMDIGLGFEAAVQRCVALSGQGGPGAVAPEAQDRLKNLVFRPSPDASGRDMQREGPFWRLGRGWEVLGSLDARRAQGV